MKRKVMLVAVAVILCSLVVMGGTLAYETITGRTTNRVHTGSIDIVLNEPVDTDKPLVPSDNLIEHEVTVENRGAGDAFIRVNLSCEWGEYRNGNFIPATDGEGENLSNENIRFETTDGWQRMDTGLYEGVETYYARIPAGSDPSVLLEGFYFVPGSNDNLYKNKKLKIYVDATAIQTVNGAMEAEWGVRYDESSKTFVKIETTAPDDPDVQP